MIPTAISQVAEQLINAIVSVVGAYLLMQTGRSMASGEAKNLTALPLRRQEERWVL